MIHIIALKQEKSVFRDDGIVQCPRPSTHQSISVSKDKVFLVPKKVSVFVQMPDIPQNRSGVSDTIFKG